MFEVSHLNLIYDMDKEEKVCAVNDVSLTLPDTGLIGIIGPSGSGKSQERVCKDVCHIRTLHISHT